MITTFKYSFFMKLLLLCAAVGCLLGAYLVPQEAFLELGETIATNLKLFSPTFWSIACRILFVGWGIALALTFPAMTSVTVTPQYIQIPCIKEPVLWQDIDRIEFTQISHNSLANFYLKPGLKVRFYMFLLLPRNATSFSVQTSALSKSKDFLALVKKYHTAAQNEAK